MGVFLLFVAVDPMMIQEINTNTGVGVNNVPVIEDHTHMDNLVLVVVKKCQVAFFHFSHEVDGVA